MSSFGELLKRERELRQISLREVSEATKINLRYLEALERNDFRHLPGGVFNKGFVRAYAQYIGVDADGMINAYLLEERNQSAESETGPRGDVLRGRRPVEAPRKDVDSISRGRQRMVVIVVAALLVVALVTVVVVWIVRGFGGRTAGELEPSAPVPRAETAVLSPEDGPATTTPDATADTPIEGDEGRSPAESAVETAAEAAPATVPETEPPLPVPEPRPTHPDEGEGATRANAIHEVVVVVVRGTSGRVVCDRRVEMLDGRAEGYELRLSCASILVVDADDGGAIRIGIDGRPPLAPGADGEAIRGRDLLAGSREPGAGHG